MIQLPQLQESLLIANERLVDRARRRARLFRTGLMTSAAVVSIGGAAAAGTALWGTLGYEDGNRPTASATPVPAGQSAVLSVLRRAQTQDDRGPAARQALATAAKRYAGIRLDEVRLLHRDATGGALVLVPTVRVGGRAGTSAPATKDALCVSAQVTGEDAALSCFTTAEVRRGAGSGSLGVLSWGLVPDGVARVVLHGRTGEDVRIPVTDNAFTVPTDDVDPDDLVVAWYDRTGAVVTPPGGPMRLEAPTVAIGSRVAPGFHDCGADGGVVPERVSCGPASRAWAPPPERDAAAPPTAP